MNGSLRQSEKKIEAGLHQELKLKEE